MNQFLRKLNDAAKTAAEKRRDEALEPFLTGAPFDGGREVNPWSVIDRVQLRYLHPPPCSGHLSWAEFRSTQYDGFRAALRGTENSAAKAIVLSFGRQILDWMREYNREKAQQHRRFYQ